MIRSVQTHQDEERKGVIYGLAAYLWWGLFPIYFQLLQASGAFEIIGYRITFSLLFCLIGLTVLRQWRQVRVVVADRRTMIALTVAGFLVATNWTLYVWGVNNGHAIDAALGYFMNPLVNAALGVLLLGERMRRAQWAAFAVGALAVVVLVVAYGKVPWVALGLAFSFGLYGLAKKLVGRSVGPLPGLAIETAATTPLALGYLGYLAAAGLGTVNLLSVHGALMMLAGPVTALPLLWFAAATARVKLSTMGMLQYVAPVLQFLIGWLYIGEEMPFERWLGFGIIWIAMAIFIIDLFGQSRRMRRFSAPR